MVQLKRHPVEHSLVQRTISRQRSLRIFLAFGEQLFKNLSHRCAARKKVSSPPALIPDGMLLNERNHIAEPALRRGLPTITWVADMTDAGVLMSYGASGGMEERRRSQVRDPQVRVRRFRETNGPFFLRGRWIVWGGPSHMRNAPMKAWALLPARHPLGNLFM
jgi:hypothetical protein